MSTTKERAAAVRIRIGDVVITERGPVVEAMIDRPEVKNAINTGVIEGLEAALEHALTYQARVLLIRGAGGTFCSGADLHHVDQMRHNAAKLDEWMARLSSLFDAFVAAPCAVVAAVEGYAVGGGLELLLACDVVIATHDARIGDGHGQYGLAPAGGAAVRLTRTLPRALAAYLLLSADLLTGGQAAMWGLVTTAVAPAELDDAVDRMVSRISDRSTHGLATIKRMMLNAATLPAVEATRRERALFGIHMTTPDPIIGLAAFHDHRIPRFAGAPSWREGTDLE